MGEAHPGAWEYLTIPETERDRLTALGQDGWELVAVGGNAGEQRLYLKRPAPSLRERATTEQRVHYYRSLGLDPDASPGGERPS
ncbi:MAG: hypothetical protein U0031_01325 [Thermomicrobiales bacterium]